MLSQEYAEAQRKARELAAKNDFYHKMAHDLLTPLTIVSTSVQVANMIPEKAPALLKKSQAEIMKMAEKINNALEDSWSEDENMGESR
jgi:signal transduction histidine kinase